MSTINVNQMVDSQGGVLAPISSVMRNRIINGAMTIDQRNNGASQTLTNNATPYTVDRWQAYVSGANATGQRVSDGAGGYRYQITGAASIVTAQLWQRIESENCADMAGNNATLSVDLANSLLTTVSWVASYANSKDNFGSTTQIATGSFTVNATPSRYNATFSVPSAATTGIQILFFVGAQTSGTFTIGKAQLEKGTQATSFEYRQYGQELALCQRYYYRIVAGTAGQVFGSGFNQSTTVAAVVINLPVQMRSAPTSLEQTGTAVDYRVNNLATATNCSVVPALATTSANVSYITFTVASGLTAGQGIVGSCNNTSAYLAWSAEL